MGQVVFTFAVGFLFIVNSVNTATPLLQVIDMVAGIYFVGMGAILGWIKARD
jgi:hypothetical protein